MVVKCVISIECREISFFLCAVKFDQVVLCIRKALAFCGLWRVPNIGTFAKEQWDKKSVA